MFVEKELQGCILCPHKILIRAVFIKQSELLHPNSKRGKFYIYRERQKILDLFHPAKLGSQNLELRNSIRNIEFQGPHVLASFSNYNPKFV
jgi:hypothetical protein